MTAHLNPLKPVAIWLLTGAVLIAVMVIVGGITRLTESGLSIVEWNVVMGSIPPLNEAQWKAQFAKYKQSPEFQQLNHFFNLSDFKRIFWWEFIHRNIGRLIGLVFVFPFLWFWYKGKLKSRLMRQVLVIFVLGAFQGFFTRA